MGRRVVHASGFGLRKCANKQHPHEDRISLLPDEILISILSLLNFKEAARTSILSKRWRLVWTYVPCLDFDGCDALDNSIIVLASYRQHMRLLRRERVKFVKWVHKVLQSHKALVLDEFRVDFDLNKYSRKEIDEWVRYAFKRRVQRLELSLAGKRSCCFYPYPFRFRSLGLSSLRRSGKNLSLDFNPLKELSLTEVDVSVEVLKFFLNNCKFLERLAVHRSTGFINLEVSGPSVALQHLEICKCYSLKSLIVCNANLVSLKISCLASLVLKNVPLLVGVSVYDHDAILKDTIKRLYCCLPKLKVLTLVIQLTRVRKLEEMSYKLPQLTELKQLTLIVDLDKSEDDSILELTSLIRASPNLEKLVLKFNWFYRKDRRHRKLEKGVNYPLQHLKVVEFCGYCGCTTELELVKYFLKNAISLEKIIIDPRRVWIYGFPRGYKCLIRPEEAEEEEDARRFAKQQLERLVPSRVGLTID